MAELTQRFGSLLDGNCPECLPKMRQRPGPLTAIVVTFGLFIALWGARSWFRASEPLLWKTVPGTLLTAEDPQLGSEDLEPRVSYRYVVAGKEYVSTRFSNAQETTSDRERVLSRVRAVQERANSRRLIVYYDPRNPRRSALTNEVSPLGFTLLNIGLLILCVTGCARESRHQERYENGALAFALSAIGIALPWVVFDWPVNAVMLGLWCCVLGVSFRRMDLAGPRA